MENIQEFLKKAMQFQDMASARAEQLLMARGCKFQVNMEGITLDYTTVTISFVESTRHDCPDSASVELNNAHLEMSDSEWSTFIQGIIKEIADKKQKQKEDSDNEILKAKQKQYARLKDELGY